METNMGLVIFLWTIVTCGMMLMIADILMNEPKSKFKDFISGNWLFLLIILCNLIITIMLTINYQNKSQEPIAAEPNVVTSTYELSPSILDELSNKSGLKRESLRELFNTFNNRPAEEIIHFLIPVWGDEKIQEILLEYEFH